MNKIVTFKIISKLPLKTKLPSGMTRDQKQQPTRNPKNVLLYIIYLF